MLTNTTGVTIDFGEATASQAISGVQRQSVAITGASHPGLPGHGDEAVAAVPAP